MKKISLLLTSILLITGCNSNSSNTSTLSSTLSNSLSTNIDNKDNLDIIIKSPNEDGGLEGNAEEDLVEGQDPTILKNLFLKVANESYYSYEVTSTVTGSETHFINYFTPYAWYEENDDPSLSFGYAEEYETGAVFKYYLGNDDKEIIPSIYEYSNYGNELTKLLTLYSPLAITHINLLLDNMDDFSATSIGVNKFLITDSDIASIFQYMTTFGSSIINYINSTYIEIIDYDSNIFKATCDLGQYGKIEGIFRPDDNSKIKFVNDAIVNYGLKGIEYHDEIYEFLNVKMNTNNFVLHGIKQPGTTKYPYTIHCTNNYFYLEYNKENYPNYDNYGFVLVPKGQEITYYEEQDDGTEIEKTQTLNYSSCYKFKQKNDGSFYFTSFVGPNEEDGLIYKEVDSLPTFGQENVLYIVEENGTKIAYIWQSTTDENGEVYNDFFEYSNWFDSVGDYYINSSIATFYLSGTPLTSIGSHYFEKDLTNDNIYYSNQLPVLSALANGLFGWGFQSTDTWMDYVKNSKIRINKDENNEIISYDVCLEVLASYNETYALHEIYYTIDSFGKGNVDSVESFIIANLGGA